MYFSNEIYIIRWNEELDNMGMMSVTEVNNIMEDCHVGNANYYDVKTKTVESIEKTEQNKNQNQKTYHYLNGY